jgi:hypothetical protein
MNLLKNKIAEIGRILLPEFCTKLVAMNKVGKIFIGPALFSDCQNTSGPKNFMKYLYSGHSLQSVDLLFDFNRMIRAMSDHRPIWFRLDYMAEDRD